MTPSNNQPPAPDPRIAAYIEEIEQPGILYVSYSHTTLYNLGREHGREVVQQLIDDYFAAKRLHFHQGE